MSVENLNRLAREFRMALDAQLAGDEHSEFQLPSREVVAAVCRHYLQILFPIYFAPPGACSGPPSKCS